MTIITSSDIIATIKKDEAIVSTSFRFPDSDILSIIDEEIRSTVVPLILKLNGDRLLFTEYATVTSSKQDYPIPYRAVASQIRELTLLDSTTNPTWKKNLTYYEFETGENEFLTGSPQGFYFKSDKIMLTPTPDSTSDYLKITYPISHSKLVSSDETAIISTVDYVTGVITFTTDVPSTFTTLETFDFIQANKKCRPAIVALDLNSSVVSGSSMTFTPASLPIGLVAGDIVALSEETSVLLIPNECYKFLCKAVELKICEAQRDIQSIQLLTESIKIAKANMVAMLTKRITGESKPVVHSYGLFNRVRSATIRRIIP